MILEITSFLSGAQFWSAQLTCYYKFYLKYFVSYFKQFIQFIKALNCYLLINNIHHQVKVILAIHVTHKD